ncbi:MAG: FKBP-type peptidyl-prolyl cis-trans isomerase [Limisphaerales bacterium]
MNYRGFLNRGEECCSSFEYQRPIIIDLDRRECIAGLRLGIEGMREGGRRELVVSPHLAYGEAGIPGRVPPNAVLRFEVELLEVREKGERKPEDYRPGKHYVIFHPGEAKRNLPRWQVGLTEEGKCGAAITFPLPDGTWRRATAKSLELRLSPEEVALVKRELQECQRGFRTIASVTMNSGLITAHRPMQSPGTRRRIPCASR